MDVFTIPNDVDINQVERNLLKTDEIHNKYKFEACIDRNVILIGRSCTGKSTVTDVIGNVFHHTTEIHLYTKTTSNIFHKLISPKIDGGLRTFLTIVDTPGFFAISRSGSSNAIIRDNATVQEFIDSCIAHDVTNVHFFALVINLAGGINSEDIDTMVYVQQHYHYLSSHAALITTHCEQSNQCDRENMIEQLFKHSELVRRDSRSFFKKGVFYMGVIRHESYQKNYSNVLIQEYNRVSDMRTNLIKAIIESEVPFNIVDKNSGQCTIF